MREVENGIVIECEIKANSKKPHVLLDGEKLCIAVTSAPIDNKANKEVIESICEVFSIKKHNVSIISGCKSRHKLVLLIGVDKQRVYKVLSELTPE